MEGQFKTCQTRWGLEIDAERGTVGIPERRITKGAHLFAGAACEPGKKRLTDAFGLAEAAGHGSIVDTGAPRPWRRAAVP